MQPINGKRIQQQPIPAQQRVPGQRQTSSEIVIKPRGGDTPALPEDVVSLSTDSYQVLDASVKKKPSVAVTHDERKALQGKFSVRA